ncbi:protein kinase [Candidatus Woesearchaeota archaeon]|jgi:serine/threonine protein kinase|nr:protein kinase [Candidatus Woesearchaeota archaeon]MBT5272025.1 protein kinase [Candidatus Woesearchaeota archaeon]MBT6040766.1 protein kinase [Candidatus Woesearchaeota archaeon]MBT6336718.1 protein kinase [Candidatus Woesearchaeota archaeon]MBT7927351.1 protein kinase [Candidatus Woesearchaeota archaeon]
MDIKTIIGQTLTGEAGIRYSNIQVHSGNGLPNDLEDNGMGFDPTLDAKQIAFDDTVARNNLAPEGAEYVKVSSNNQQERTFFKAESEIGVVFLKPVKYLSREHQFYQHLKANRATHPAIMPLEDVIHYNGKKLLVFPFVPFFPCADNSVTLDEYMLLQRIQDVPDKDKIILSIGYAIADALDFMNENNAIHLDIKPQNILCCPEDHSYPLRLCDFEAAKIGERSSVNGNLKIEVEDIFSTLFTPMYSSPEFIEKQLTPQADVYSLGCILYDLFCGEREAGNQNIFGFISAFSGDTAAFKLMMDAKGEGALRDYGFLVPSDARNAKEIPDYIKPVIANCLEFMPTDRYIPRELKNELFMLLL